MNASQTILIQPSSCVFSVDQAFFMLFSIAQISFFLSCVFASKVYNKYDRSDDEDCDNEDDESEIKYTDKYPIEDAGDNVTKEVNENSYVTDITPNGMVMMKYNYEEEGFEYWTDRSISYAYLETVARKYVTQFSCSNLYVNRQQILEEKRIAIKEKKQREDDCCKMLEEDKREQSQNVDPDKDDDNVFASFKSYNTVKGKISKNNSSDTVVVSDKSNKYINKGRISEFKFLKRHVEVDSSHVKPIDFAAFKRMKMGIDYTPKTPEQKKDD